MPEGAERQPQPPDEEAKEIARKRLYQAARNLVIAKGWTHRTDWIKHSSQIVEDIKGSYKQFDEAALELGENPLPYDPKDLKKMRAWNHWNYRHYFEPIREQLKEVRRKRNP